MKIEINENRLQLEIGDITAQQTDAIVNAANGSLLGGGGVDGAIHRKSGPELLEECKQIRKKKLNNDYLATGEAVLTKGYNLPAAYVIHTVGPIWNSGNNNERHLLTQCYQNALQLAVSNNMTSISFPSISTGVYQFPINLAAEIALQTITSFLQNHSFGKVTIISFSEQDYLVYSKTLKEIQAKKK